MRVLQDPKCAIPARQGYRFAWGVEGAGERGFALIVHADLRAVWYLSYDASGSEFIEAVRNSRLWHPTYPVDTWNNLNFFWPTKLQNLLLGIHDARRI